MAVVLETSDQSARIGFQPGRELGGAVSKQRQTGIITLDGVRWAKAASGPARGRTPTAVSQVLSPGDIIYADPLISKDGSVVEGQYRLRQLPEVSGAMVVMDPWTGRVLAMVGGFSFDQSQFNRATQAYRQPGSSFKPLVYSSALDNGYTPSTVVMDAPFTAPKGRRHARRGSPSTSTVQAPHPPCWQPALGLVIPSSSRSTARSGVSSGLSTSRATPLTVIFM
jgi:penicillin-binding protein 1A